jgi:S-adenosylmethionine uptake transporter
MQSLWMLVASFLFAFMGACAKLASQYYSTSEIIMYRGIVGVLFLALMVKLRGGSLKTPIPWLHLRRGVIGVTALWMWFYAIGSLPLPTATTLNYMSPIWMAAMLFAANWWRGKDRFEWSLVGAILLSFAGVALLLRPSFQADLWFPALIGLSSGVLSALAYLQVRHLGHLGEPEYRVVFYFSATSAVGGLASALASPHFGGQPIHGFTDHGLKGIALLLTVGVCATVAQMAMTRAYHRGKPLVAANLQYTGIVFSTCWSMLIWNDIPGWMAWLGIAIILMSGIVSTIYNSRNARTAAAETVEGADADPIAAEM